MYHGLKAVPFIPDSQNTNGTKSRQDNSPQLWSLNITLNNNSKERTQLDQAKLKRQQFQSKFEARIEQANRKKIDILVQSFKNKTRLPAEKAMKI